MLNSSILAQLLYEGFDPVHAFFNVFHTGGIAQAAEAFSFEGDAGNDGDVLLRSINDLKCLAPAACSIALVPVGLTKHRDGLDPIEPYTKESAAELIHMIEEARLHDIRAIFVEENGSGSAASIIAAETGVKEGVLSMAMSGDDYFSAMYTNIDSLKEALQ